MFNKIFIKELKKEEMFEIINNTFNVIAGATAFIALIVMIILFRTNKVKEPIIILAAALIGLILKLF